MTQTGWHKFKKKEEEKKMFRDFPGSTVAKNPLANAGDMGSIPGPETKIPHALGQLSWCIWRLSPWSATREATDHNEKPVVFSRESLRASSEDPAQPETNNLKNNCLTNFP